jgi:hypothetical protein
VLLQEPSSACRTSQRRVLVLALLRLAWSQSCRCIICTFQGVGAISEVALAVHQGLGFRLVLQWVVSCVSGCDAWGQVSETAAVMEPHKFAQFSRIAYHSWNFQHSTSNACPALLLGEELVNAVGPLYGHVV